MRSGRTRRGGSTTTAKTSRSTARRAKAKQIELIDEGRHGLAALKRVPVFQLKVSDGLWLMNKAALLQLEHFNKSNALAWALTMGLFATAGGLFGPRIQADRGRILLHPTRAGGPVRMDGAGRARSTRSRRTTWSAEGRNLSGLLPDEPGGARAAASVRQSGLSKQRDFSVTQEVLRAYGDAVKDTMKQVLRRDRGGAAGRGVGGRFGAGRVRYRRLQ